MAQFHLQIHITGNCNCRCKHCYVAPNACELSVDAVENILQQYGRLISMLEEGQKEVLPYVYITGGEPFLHGQILEIFQLIEKYAHRFTFRIMTNGTVLNPELLEAFQKLPIGRLQVSIDGNEQTHDGIRGKGNLARVLKGLDTMKAQGIQTRVSFTANAENYRQFPEVAQICREHGVSVLWSDRYVACQENQVISPLDREQTREYVELLELEKRNEANRQAGLTVKNVRALQFLASGEYPYHCSAGITALAVDEKGEVYPCRRFALSCGNVFEKELKDIYLDSKVMQTLRQRSIPQACMACRHKKLCRGGSRCGSLAAYGDYLRADPGCWLWEENP